MVYFLYDWFATSGAGCFWHPEEVFRKLLGVISTRVGYMGGTLEKPTYDQVCYENTRHAEVADITFNLSAHKEAPDDL